LSGVGRSTIFGGEISIDNIAYRAHGLLGKLYIRKVIIVSLPMGGNVAPDFAARYLDRTSAVTAIGPVNPNGDAAGTFENRGWIVPKGKLREMAWSQWQIPL
jgi:pimeloyl-ACP methyl ester carboxylesterase